MRLLKNVARLILLSPIILVVLGLVCTYIPGAPEFLDRLFWQSLGQAEVFSIASELLEGSMGYSSLSPEHVMNGYMYMLANAILDAAVMGTTVFLVKAINIRFNRKYIAYYITPEWLSTVIGIVIGVLLLTANENLFAQLEGSLSALMAIGFMILGIRLMLGKRSTPVKGGKYHNRMMGTIISLLFDILENMITALCAGSILTCVMEGPKLLKADGNIVVWLTWVAISIIIYFVLNWIGKIRHNA